MTIERVLAIIGGSVMHSVPGFVAESSEHARTPWGEPSAPVHCGRIGALRVLYLARHGERNAIAPHRINYRANLHALHALGATDVLAIATVGGIAPDAGAGSLWLPEQIIDYTWGRDCSFHDGSDGGAVRFVEFEQPYDRALGADVARAAARCAIALRSGGTYGCTQGPRLETAAEIRRLRNDGCDLVGMTAMPEAALARELGLPYAALAMVVNRAAGLEAEPITMEAIMQQAQRCVALIARIVVELARELTDQRP